MAIVNDAVEDIQGFAKEIDQGALNQVLDNLQMHQYQYPQKSAIRELVSNGIDAVTEKRIALSILSGETKVSDHFIERHDALNGDSNFDPKYYDPEWLFTERMRSTIKISGTRPLMYNDPDTVYVTYEDGGVTEKDKVIIEDFGPGLGGHRLEGYFKIGFSTKRNTKEALGKFGIGAKAGLATAPFYTMTSHYNGREYQFIVYPHKIQSIVPRLNMETGKENGLHLFSNNAVIYYRETKMPNGVRVELESKKHHKQLYIDAVKSQLLYFPNVEFRVRNSNGGLDIIPVRATILYEDEHILLSDNNQYSKPHALISRVNYGYIDFKEMELEDIQGNIAFKIAAEDVTVNMSRESLVWDERTKETVVSYFHKIRGTAERMISEQLKVTDFIEWLEACAQIQNRFSTDSVVGRLTGLVNMSDAKIQYVNDPRIVYGLNLFDNIKVRVNELETVREGSIVKYKITRKDKGVIQALADGLPIYMQSGGASFTTDKYLLQSEHPTGFITIVDPFINEDGTRDRNGKAGEILVRRGKEHANKVFPQSASAPPQSEKHMQQWQAEAIKEMSRLLDVCWAVIEWLSKSKHLLQYDEVVIPEAFDGKEEVEDEKTIEKVKAKEEREKIRRANGEIPVFTPRNVTSSYIGSGVPEGGYRLYEWQQINMPVSDIDAWDEEEIFYGNEKDQELLHLVAAITRPKQELCWSPTQLDQIALMKIMQLYAVQGVHMTSDQTYKTKFYNVAGCHNFFRTTGEKPRVKLIKVAQERVKFFMDFKPIQRFFLDIKNKTLTMSSALIRWNTARLIHQELPKLQFLRNFGRFHPRYRAWFIELDSYATQWYRELKDHTKDDKYYGLKQGAYDDLVRHMEKVTQFQLFVRDNPSEESKIAELAREMFNPKTEITDGLAIEIGMYDKLKELLDFAQPISILLNEVGRLKGSTDFISEELEHEIKAYIELKGVSLTTEVLTQPAAGADEAS